MTNPGRIFIPALWAALFFAAGLYVPLLGQAVALFIPVPLIIASVQSGRREGLATLIVAAVIIFGLFGRQAAAVFLFGFGLMAVGISEGMRRRLKPERTVMLGGLMPVAVLSLAVLYYFMKIGKNPAVVLEEYLKDGIAEAVKLYAGLGLKEAAEIAASVSDKFVYYFVRLMPSFVITTAVVQAMLCYGLAKSLIVKRLGDSANLPRTSLATWYAPDPWIWGFITALALLAAPSSIGRIAGWNLVILFTIVYTAQGMAVLESALKKASIPVFGRGFIHAVILATPLMVFLMSLGVVDVWADFRKFRAAEKKKR